MATAIVRLQLDRNPAAFTIPSDLPGSQARLAGLLSSTFQRINTAFQRIKSAVDGPDNNPNTPAIINVVTGGSIVGGNLVLTTENVTVLNHTAGSDITITGTDCT